MGLSEQWIGVRDETPGVADALTAAGLAVLGVTAGWTWGRGYETDALDELVPRLAREAGAAAVGGWVADSDCAYLVFATPAGELAARVAINERLPFGEPVDELPDLWADLVARSEAFAAMARWSAVHGQGPIDVANLLREMPGGGGSPPCDGLFFAEDDPWIEDDGPPGWVFAEDGVRLVYDRLGLPSIDQTVFNPERTDAERVARLVVNAPDQESMRSLFEHLNPRFGDRILFSMTPTTGRHRRSTQSQTQSQKTRLTGYPKPCSLSKLGNRRTVSP